MDAATSIWTVIAQADRAEEEDGGPSGGANQLEDDEIKKSAPTDNARPVELKLARIAVPERLISWERSESYGASSTSHCTEAGQAPTDSLRSFACRLSRLERRAAGRLLGSDLEGRVLVAVNAVLTRRVGRAVCAFSLFSPVLIDRAPSVPTQMSGRRLNVNGRGLHF